MAAHRQAGVRDPQAALADFQWFEEQFRARLQGGGVPADMIGRREVVVLDLKAALMASLGRYQEAIQASSEAVQLARNLNAPPAYLQDLSARGQRYRQKSPFYFEGRVPVVD